MAPKCRNVFTRNTSAFAPYAESISALGTAYQCITAFGPSSAALVPPAITTDTNSEATQFIFKTLYDNEVDLEEVPQSPTFLTASTHRRATAVPTSSRDASCSQSQVSQGCSQTQQSGGNPNPNKGDGGGEDPNRPDPSGDHSPGPPPGPPGGPRGPSGPGGPGGPPGGPPAGGAAGPIPTEPTPQQLLALFQNFTGSLDTRSGSWQHARE
ncbi:hypothetical protein BT96DRAFT_1002044 [Gymnopus androsaceus JB14]|uniref:Uncharacterized protein n=1 Tax=Gymnopus androsaceus JB14 TaxID=1447944 RepID=A0A6A4GZ87_9AGAR|nr:hypothetical protein BT96DRAFT_1002044 [Gymnopus androsaceus JB14]